MGAAAHFEKFDEEEKKKQQEMIENISNGEISTHQHVSDQNNNHKAQQEAAFGLMITIV